MQPLPVNRTTFPRQREKSTRKYVATLPDTGYQSGYGTDSGLSSTQTISESDKSRDTPPFFQDKPRRVREKSTHMLAPPSAPVCPLPDYGYQSDFGSDSGLSDIRSTCSSTQTITESDRSRDTPPFFQDKPRRVRSRGKDTTLLSKIESIVADLMKCEASPVVVAVSLVVTAAVLCFVGSLFTRERGATPEVKIVLPSYSGEGKITAETDKMLKQVIEELKKEVERRVRSEIQAKKDTSEATEVERRVRSEIQAKKDTSEATEVERRVRSEIQAKKDTRKATKGCVVSIVRLFMIWPTILFLFLSGCNYLIFNR
ncbi:uncharacterized protein LOC130181049 isoform X2 [Seriola aureovittata]|uniref:uncharacterized protein LOC130181049 isoform X2 n=1 Tax=Seriola aureovittata TaxID=2871759 RepID=UPI0024BE669F|nr:uncharacterized protein LOC130181049 isoform X2 [Seriola aureovittata]XP_056250768.1 uncharacterized protein LOC130181049 isoform X2 [Seriola aureovittata]